MQLVRDHEQRVGPPPHRVETRHADDDADAPRHKSKKVRHAVASAPERLAPVDAARVRADLERLVPDAVPSSTNTPRERVEAEVQRDEDQRGPPQDAVEGDRRLVAEAEGSEPVWKSKFYGAFVLSSRRPPRQTRRLRTRRTG